MGAEMGGLKTVLVAVAVVAILAAVFLLPSFAMPYSFEQGLAELDSIWESEGAGFFLEGTELETLSRSTILGLKSDTLDFKKRVEELSDSEDKSALLMLSDVYFARLNVFLARKDVMVSLEAYAFSGEESDSEVCSRLCVLEGARNALQRLFAELRDFDEKAVDFSLGHNRWFQASGVSPMYAETEHVEQTLIEYEKLVFDVQEACT